MLPARCPRRAGITNEDRMTTTPAATPPQPQILCEKCRAGYMYSAKVPRFSEGLRLIGFTLWIPSLLLLGLATLLYLMTLAGAGTATVAGAATEITPPLHDRLESVAGLSPSFIEAAKDGRIEEKDWAMVPDKAREHARKIVSEYESEQIARGIVGAGGVIGTTALAGVGGCGLVLTYFVLLPLFIVGLVLIMKKSVWCCPSCRYIYDRA